VYANVELFRMVMVWSDLPCLREHKSSTRTSIAVPCISQEEECKELSAARTSLDNSEPFWSRMLGALPHKT
jgi:hypothetical protein